MKKFLAVFFVVIILNFLPESLCSQVLTRILSKSEKMSDFMPYPISKQISYKIQPSIDFKRVLEEDERKGKKLHRVAVKVEKDFRINDGLWNQYGNMMIWQIGFSAPTAKSLSFLIKDIFLPNGAEMYVISKEENIIHGPITKSAIFENVYATDIIESSNVMILIKTDIDNYDKVNLNIHGICQGIPKLSSLRSWQEAANCHYDVNCSAGQGWEKQRDAVAFVTINGEDLCSGALINNQCQDIRSFFLTAFHCLDFNDDRLLDQSESNLINFSFKFKYESSQPQCPGTTTGNQGISLTYSGAILRSSNWTTDFALIELNGNVINQPSIALAGWNRGTEPATNTTIIHHPEGDAKKITKDYHAALNVGVLWRLNVDLGVTEVGSSGAPYFDQNKRIFGQHFTIAPKSSPICQRTTLQGGRFDLSWTGQGPSVPNNNLSDWLGGTNPPTTLDAISSPWINYNNSNYVCTSNKIITLTNPVPEKSITWSVNNTHLFSTSSGATTSGTGAVATIRAADSNSRGSAILTFILTQIGCNPISISQEIWIGKPEQPSTFPNNYPSTELIVNQTHTVFINNAKGTTSFSWSASGAVSLLSGDSNQGTFRGNYVGNGNWHLTASNVCGSTFTSGGYDVINPYGYRLNGLVVNNPVQNELIVSIPEYMIMEFKNLNGNKFY